MSGGPPANGGGVDRKINSQVGQPWADAIVSPFDMGPEPRKCTCQSQSSLQHLAAFSRRPVIAAMGRYVQWRRESLPLAGTPEPQHSSQNHLGLLPSSVVTLCGS